MNKTIKGIYEADLNRNMEQFFKKQEKCEERGVPYCYICGKEIKDTENRSLRVIEGGDVFTEYNGEDLDRSADCGWWFIGSTCYKKYKKLEKDVEVRVNDCH